MLQIRHLPPSRLMMNSFPFAYLALHEGSRRVSLERLDLRPDHALSVELAGAEWLFIWMTETRDEGITQHTLKGQVTRGVASQVALGIGWDFPAWSIENYVLVPGAVYGGNRFVREPDGYPPPTKGPQPGEPRDRLHTIDLPGLRLAEDPAQSWLDQYSLDAAVPGIGVQLAATGEGFFAFTRQLSNVGAYSYEVLENDARTSAQLLVGTPGLRHEKAYAIPYQRPGGYVLDSDDQAVDLVEGEAIICEVSVHQFACPDRQTLFQRCFTFRDALFQDPPLRKEVPFSYTWDTIHRKQNAVNWRENLSLYQTSILGEAEPPAPTLLFQVGWCGGLIVTYPMLQEGDPVSVERALRHLDFLFTGLSPSGLLYPFFNSQSWQGQHDGAPEGPPITLTRRVGDALYSLVRKFLLLRERGLASSIKPEWETALRNMLAAVAGAWERFGDLGQYLLWTRVMSSLQGRLRGRWCPRVLFWPLSISKMTCI